MATKPTAAKLFAETNKQYALLSEIEQAKFRKLVQNRSYWLIETAWDMLDLGMNLNIQRRRAKLEKAKNSHRSKPEEFPERNKLIRDEHVKGLTAGQIAKKHRLDYEAVRGVINRAKKKASTVRI